MLSPKLTRWIVASFAKYIKENCAPYQFILYKIDNIQADHLEMYVEGPYTWQYGPRDYECRVQINLFVTCTQDDKNPFKFEEMKGLAASLLSRDYCINKIGSTDDDGSLVGTMQILTDASNPVQINNYGASDANLPLFQASAEAKYKLVNYEGEA